MIKRIISAICKECGEITPIKELKQTIVDKRHLDIMLIYIVCPKCEGKSFYLISYEIETKQ
jgi:RNase P subunit RPR2